MQISTDSLLAAQQARSQTPAQPRAVQTKMPETDGFEELLFAKAPASAAPPDVARASATPKIAAPFARPGSQLDIKI